MIFQLVNSVFRIYGFLIMARVILSWFPQANSSPVVDMIYKLTEPVIGPCRDLLNAVFKAIGIDTRTFPLDFSPLLAYFLMDWVIRAAVLSLLDILF